MKHRFDESLSFEKIFWIFIIGCVIGAYYEEILFIIKYFIRYGVLAWEPRRGVFWGPLSPIYGMGAVVMSLFLINKHDKSYVTFFKALLIGGTVEYIINLLQEVFLGTTSWNYSHHFLNINGRTTIPIMIAWGILGVMFLKIIYPLISRIFESLPSNIGKRITILFMILVAIDMLISWTALGRQTLRHNGIKPMTSIGEFYDKYFNDDYITRKFPNMVRSK